MTHKEKDEEDSKEPHRENGKRKNSEKFSGQDRSTLREWRLLQQEPTKPAPEAGTAHCPAGQSENSRFRTPLRAVRKLLFSSLRQCSAVRKQCTGDIQPDQMSQARVTLRQGRPRNPKQKIGTIKTL